MAVKRRRVRANPGAMTRERRVVMVVSGGMAAMETDGRMKSLEKPAQGFERKPDCVINSCVTLRYPEVIGPRMFPGVSSTEQKRWPFCYSWKSFQDDSLVPSKVANNNTYYKIYTKKLGLLVQTLMTAVGTKILEWCELLCSEKLPFLVFSCGVWTRLTSSHKFAYGVDIRWPPVQKSCPIRAVAEPRVPES